MTSVSPKQKAKSEELGTVLVRQAQPKYSFQGKKLPRESTTPTKSPTATPIKPQTDSPNNGVQDSSPGFVSKPTAVTGPMTTSSSHHLTSSTSSQNLGSPSFLSSNNGNKPVAVVGASYKGRSIPHTNTAPDLTYTGNRSGESAQRDVLMSSSSQKDFLSGQQPAVAAVSSFSPPHVNATCPSPSPAGISQVDLDSSAVAGDSSALPVAPVAVSHAQALANQVSDLFLCFVGSLLVM